MFFKQFGGRVTRDLEKQYKQSPHWKNGSFQNFDTTSLTPSVFKIPGIIYKQLRHKGGEPEQPLPILAFDKKAFSVKSKKSKFIWYGHSAIMMRMKNKTILIDPMLGPDTTPIAPVQNKRFSENTLDLIDEFPEIDLMLITHDHYDHLDYASIQKLKNKTKQYFVALGVKRHLLSWGVLPELITEFDWWDEKTFSELKITFTPTQHFSGRGLTDRLKTLWGGWAFKTGNENIWFSGDGGYGEHFKEIGERLGPFDFAFMECGQYNDAWRPVHLFPDESVQAAIDAKAKKTMPVHWAGFNLSFQHTWSEPAEEFVKAAVGQNHDYVLPRLGEIFEVDLEEEDRWWTNYQ